MTRDATTAFARTLVDEWTRHGVTDAVLAPGSRSAPLALALAGDERIRLHVHLDERSAAFFALGLARATGVPAPLLCTSGTAAANFFPAVLEAHHGLVPMIVCTADRPPELRDTGAGQTIDQLKLYGDAVRWFQEANVPTDRAADPAGVGAEWRALASRSVAEAVGRPAGAVHLNLPFREPLVPTGDELVDAPGRSDDRPWTADVPGVRAPSVGMLDALAHLVADRPKGLIVAGWGAGVLPGTLLRFAEVTGWPVLADPLSNGRVPGTISTYDPLLRDAAFRDAQRPDVVFRVGGPTTNKPLVQWLDAACRPGRRRPRRRVARPAACGERAHGGRRRVAPGRARRCDRRDGRRGVGRRLDASRRRRPRRDRRADRAVGRAIRGPDRARRRRRVAARERARGRVEHAGSRRRELRGPARRHHVPCEPRRERHRRLHVDRARHRRGPVVRGCRRDGRAHWRPLLPPRHQRPARCRAPGHRRDVRGGRQRRRRDLLLPPTGRPPRALRDGVRHAPGRRPRPRCARCTTCRSPT